MPLSESLVQRCARRLQSAYAELQAWHDPPGQLPYLHWDAAGRQRRELQLALDRGWYAAARIVADRLTRTLALVESHLADLRRPLVDRLYRANSLPTLRHLQAEILAVADEFPDVRLEAGESRLIAASEPIVLDGIYLGAFEIRLDLEDPSVDELFTVRALDPQPAACDDDVPHPHVRGNRLCTGDGHSALQRALRDARLCDFFQIVSRILSTYNSGSAYVSLDNWRGEPCTGCGDIVDDDDRYHCERCQDTYCSNCLDHCSQCEAWICSSCGERCAGCDSRCCSRCLDICPTCVSSLCDSCQELPSPCPNCATTEPESEKVHESANISPTKSTGTQVAAEA